MIDQDLYHDLRRQGLLLGDFLDQQLAALRAQQTAAVDSGLALDLLAYHTTPLGTATQRSLAEVHATYAHQTTTLDGLLAACRELYLLIDPAENRPDAEPTSRLPHDTLAPLVRNRFEESDAPGQRARRILESRESNGVDQPLADPLGEADLAIVEAGQAGMRKWHDPEVKLIDLSRAAREKRRKRDQLSRLVLVTSMVVITVVAGIAFWQWGVARDQAEKARTAQATAQAEATRADEEAAEALDAKATAEAESVRADEKAAEALDAQATAVAEAENARQAQVEAEVQARIARAGALAAHGQTELASPTDSSGSLALILAIDAVQTTLTSDETVLVGADAALRAAIDAAPPYVMTLPRHRPAGYALSATWSPDGKQIVTASDDDTAHIWDAATGEEVRQLVGHTDWVRSAAWSPDGNADRHRQ